MKPVGVADVDSVDAGHSGDAVGLSVIPVLANDTDGNGPKPTQPTAGLFILSAPDPAMGTAVVQGSNVRFTPADGYEGPVTFTYRVCEDPAAQNPPYNGFGLCGAGKVTVNVLGNDAPDAVDDEFATVNLDTRVARCQRQRQHPHDLRHRPGVGVGPAEGGVAVDLAEL
jgi:hypothetical protein